METNTSKYLTFYLGNEEYGINIINIKEIIGLMSITCIPNTPQFIKGVINLRGKIIPIMDLRLKFGMDEHPYNERTCIIIVEMNLDAINKYIGIVVDTVSEVLNIDKKDIAPPMGYGYQTHGDFLLGIAKVEEKVIMLLNTDGIVDGKEIIPIN